VKATHLEVVDAVDAAEWDAQVGRLGGTIFHSSVWADYVQAQQPNSRPRYARFLSGDGSLIGLCLMFAEVSTRKVLAPLTGKLWTDAVPLVGNGGDDVSAAFAKSITQYARKQSLASIVVGSFGGSPGDGAFGQLGFRRTRYWEFVHDLSVPEDVLWEKMEYKRHKNIRKAERLGVILEDQNGVHGIAELRRLQGDSGARIIARGGPDIAGKNRSDADPVKVLLDSGLGRIVCARVDGQVVSAGLFTSFNGIVYHTLSGHSEAALRSQAPTFLLWQTIKRYKAEGSQRFDFGGCDVAAAAEGHPEHGVYVYKEGFGGERIDCVTFDSVLLPVRHCAGVWLKRAAQGWSTKARPHHAVG
jgi:CelD/BcsL family acetyltransferase involved in cellulose biosynthesis